LQRRARVDAEGLDQGPSRRLVCRERFGLPPRAVEREHQLAAQPLAERVLGDQAFELTDELGVAAAFEVELEASLQRGQAKLLQASGLRLRKGLEGEVSERRSPPESKRLA